jgi:hypothetical protein
MIYYIVYEIEYNSEALKIDNRLQREDNGKFIESILTKIFGIA